MLCSISTGRSGGNWLDRLRSSKGFPSGEDLDLEQFLNHPNPSHSDSSDTKLSNSATNNIDDTETNSNLIVDDNQTTEIPNQNGEKLLGVMSNVLAELFNMGDSDGFPRMNGKKSCRKQLNPKICIVSNVDERCSDDARRDEVGGGLPTPTPTPTLPFSGDNNNNNNSCMEIINKQKSSDQTTKPPPKNVDVNVDVDVDVDVDVGPVYVEEVEEEAEEKSHADLSSFSRIQVTVIDTSCPTWRFEKLLFRRKNVWKVRDKKGQSINFFRKKRKAILLDENNVVGNGEKELQHCIAQCSLAAKEPNGGEFVAPSDERQSKIDRTEETDKQTPHISQVPEKRFPRKSKKAAPSVVLIKSLPTSKRHGADIHKSCLKSTQRQQNV